MQDRLVALSWLAVAIGLASTFVIAIDILAGRRQHMWIMNLVRPLAALYSGFLGLCVYYRVERDMTHAMRAAKRTTAGPRSSTARRGNARRNISSGSINGRPVTVKPREVSA